MKTKVWIALLALYIVWGSTYLAIRFSVETIPPFLHASIRFLISGVILFTWRRLAGDPAPTWSNWKSTAIVGTALAARRQWTGCLGRTRPCRRASRP